MFKQIKSVVLIQSSVKFISDICLLSTVLKRQKYRKRGCEWYIFEKKIYLQDGQFCKNCGPAFEASFIPWSSFSFGMTSSIKNSDTEGSKKEAEKEAAVASADVKRISKSKGTFQRKWRRRGGRKCRRWGWYLIIKDRKRIRLGKNLTLTMRARPIWLHTCLVTYPPSYLPT